MYSKSTKSILKQNPIDLYEEVETARGSGHRSEQLFDKLFGNTKKHETYGNRRKPLMTVNSCLSPNQRPIDSSVSDVDCNDTDFEPSAKTLRTKIQKRVNRRQNRVKFAESCDKTKANKTNRQKKVRDYPNCTKQTLLDAFQKAGLPDYEEIAKMPLHVTKMRDYVKPDPPTPPMHQIMAPFADLIDWSKEDKTVIESNVMSGSAKQMTGLSNSWETESTEDMTEIQNNNDFQNSIYDSISKSVSNKRSSVKSNTVSKLEFKRESLKTAGVGAHRIASTPIQRRHNVTLKNISPIDLIDSPEVDTNSKIPVILKSNNSFVAPLPRRTKSQRVPKISVPKEDKRLDIDIVEPSISDLQKVTLNKSRSKELSRTLIDASKPSIISEETVDSQTIVENTKTRDNSRALKFGSSKQSLNIRNKTLQKTNDLSSLFDPIVKSTPLLASKPRNRKPFNCELVVDKSHFDSSMSMFCRSHSTSKLNDFPFKTTTIIPIPISDESIDKTVIKSRKQLSRPSNAYHLYRQSIASVQSLYNKSCQPFRTVIKTFDYNNTLDDLNNQTIRSVLNNESDLREAFDQSLITSMFSTTKVVSNNGKQSVLTAKQKVLIHCEPKQVIDFKLAFDKQVLKVCHKIGEGSFGEVFASKDSTGRDVVIKIIPLIQNENQTEEDIFAQILPELVISLNFNQLKRGIASNRAPNFIDMIKAMVTKGQFPSKLVDEWDLYDARKKSENEDPRTYTKQQQYIVLYLANGGSDLESYQFKSAIESLSIFSQLALALAAAEDAFQFEHRDLHWGNVLVNTTTETNLNYCVNGKEYTLSPNGVFASIIDFSLSRMTDNEFIIFDDLAKYSDLFEGSGDYQFDVYRLMKELNRNDWEKFVPKTNIFWLHYILEKTITAKKYSQFRTKVHKNAIEMSKQIYESILGFSSATELIKSNIFATYLSHLKTTQQ